MHSLQLMPAIFAEFLAHEAGAHAVAGFLLCIDNAILAHESMTSKMD